MTKLRNPRLAAALAAIVAALAAMVAAPVKAQSVEDILAQHYEAVGGVDGWTGLTTMKASGTLNVMGGMMTGPFTIVQKRPAMARAQKWRRFNDVPFKRENSAFWVECS